MQKNRLNDRTVTACQRLQLDYGNINFSIDERRETDTCRASLGLELNFQASLTPMLDAFLRAGADANLDFVDGEGTCHTAQTGIFAETVRAD